MHEEDLKSMKSFDEVLEKDLRKEVKRIVDQGTITPTDVKTITDAICLMLKSKEYEAVLENDGYSPNSFGHNPYGMSYGGSYAPSRSSVTGRYISREMAPYYADDRYPSHGRTNYDMGYSGHSTKDRMVARLEDMMGEAKNEYEMNMIRDAISKIQMA